MLIINQEYSRYFNESEEEYIYRVCSQKENIGTWDMVADIINKELNYEYTESKYRKTYQAFTKMFNANNCEFSSDDKIVTDKIKISYKNEESTFEGKIIELMSGEPITPDILLKAYNIDTTKFEITWWTANLWQSQVKGGKKLDMYQSKLTVKPIKNKQISFEDISKYFDNKQWENIKLPEPKRYDKNGETLEIDVADLHSGLLSWEEETGNNYDLNIVQDVFVKCIMDIKQRCVGRKFKKIILANLGDIIHVDNNNNTTTRGTQQQVDGRIEKIVQVTFNMYIKAIEILSEIAPIEFINVKGNHDEVISFMFAFALNQAFRNNENISFDISPNPKKARLIGKSLVGFEHNSGSNKVSGDWLVNDYRDLFGKCAYAEIHSGHLHSQHTDEKGTGVIVKKVPALCNSSAWEHISGYRSYKAITCYVWHDDLLLRETWFNYI